MPNATHILSGEELIQAIRNELERIQPKITQATAQAVLGELDTRLELLGMAAADAESREAKRKDQELLRRSRVENWEEDIRFARSMRLRVEAVASAIIKGMLILAFAGFLSLAAWGGLNKIGALR